MTATLDIAELEELIEDAREEVGDLARQYLTSMLRVLTELVRRGLEEIELAFARAWSQVIEEAIAWARSLVAGGRVARLQRRRQRLQRRLQDVETRLRWHASAAANPEERCGKCGQPRGDHRARHQFVG